jgi:iron(III) transport system ATP-binding protein
VLRLENVRFSYGRREVLAGVDLEARRGEVLALLGRTGGGKSTCLRLLAGLEVPASGKVFVGESAVAGDGHVFVAPEARRVALVFQSLALWPHMTVRQSLEFVAEPRLESGRAEPAVRGILEDLGIAHLAERRPAGLSGGESALAAVARALAQDPRALLLDEPFEGLDSDRRDQIREKVFDLARSRGLACAYVTHMRSEALASVDRLAVMAGGRVVQSDPPGEVYARPLTAEVARLTGDVGLLPAEITATCIVTPVGPFPRSSAPRAESLGTGWKGFAALRPEALRLAGDGPLSGRVRSAEFRAGRWRLGVRVGGPGAGGADLPVDVERSPAVGGEVRLSLAGDLALVSALPGGPAGS